MNKSNLYYFTSIGSACIASYLLYKTIYKNNKLNIEYIEKQKAQQFIMNDKDMYITNMSNADLHARNVKSKAEYIMKSKNDIIDFTQKEKRIINNIVIKVNNHLKKKRNAFVDPVLLDSIPWKFVLSKGYYEEGLPHTRGEYIFLSLSFFNQSEDSQISTLAHEKVHLYQRKYKREFIQTLLKNNYTIYGLRNDFINIRCNPDVDEYIYIHPTNYIMATTYRNDKPDSILDVDQESSEKEHPNEEIAYSLGYLSHLT